MKNVPPIVTTSPTPKFLPAFTSDPAVEIATPLEGS